MVKVLFDFERSKKTFDFCSDAMALKKKQKKNKTSMFLMYVMLRSWFFLFQHGEKHFKYSRIGNKLTFEVILVILACMMRAFFAQNNCFLLLVFLFVFFSLQRASGKCILKQKHCYHQLLSENICHIVNVQLRENLNIFENFPIRI